MVDVSKTVLARHLPKKTLPLVVNLPMAVDLALLMSVVKTKENSSPHRGADTNAIIVCYHIDGMTVLYTTGTIGKSNESEHKDRMDVHKVESVD